MLLMEPTTTLLTDSLAVCLPYTQASPQQLSQVLAFEQEELQLHFPALSWATRTNTLLKLQPDLWREDTRVYLDYEDLTYLTRRLATSPEIPQLKPSIYNSRASYMAKRLVNYQDPAIDALTDIEAHPLAYGGSLFTLVTDLAVDNSVADKVFRATHRNPQERLSSLNPAAARTTAHERIHALRGARRAFGHTESSPRSAG